MSQTRDKKAVANVFLPRICGYDVRILAQLDHNVVRDLARLSEAWLLSHLLICWAPAYAMWLMERSLSLSVLTAFITFAFLLNLLRVSVAGGGVGAHATADEVQKWRPALGPGMILLALGVLMASPAQLPLWDRLEPQIAAHRRTLEQKHSAAAVALGLESTTGKFQRAVSDCAFMVQRFRLIWSKPTRAAGLALFYCLLILLPELFGRFFVLTSRRAYERNRWRDMQRLVVIHMHENEHVVQTALARWPTYRRPAAGSSQSSGRASHPLAETLL